MDRSIRPTVASQPSARTAAREPVGPVERIALAGTMASTRVRGSRGCARRDRSGRGPVFTGLEGQIPISI